MTIFSRTIFCCLLLTLFLNKKMADGSVCEGEMLLVENNGIIESPGFKDNLNYPTELTCKWIIAGPLGSTVSLIFEEFSLEESKTCDYYDYVTIKERCAGMPGISGNLGGRDDGYCGNYKPPEINSTCNELLITFRSDDSDTAKGFRAKYIIHKNSDAPMITCFGDETYCAGTSNKDEIPTFSARASESFTFHCRVSGNPRPRRYWDRLDGKSLPADAIDDNNGTLTIPRLRYPDDNGQYVCVANNVNGEDKKYVKLNVITKCPCPPNITTNWFYIAPYVTVNPIEGDPTGIFPELIKTIIDTCCGNCSMGHGISHLKYGAPKETRNDVKDAITSNEVVHISFPIAGKETDDNYKGDYYRPLVTSPGVAVLVLKDPNKSANAIFSSVISTWPLVLLTFVIAWLAGIVMWALDTWNNPDEFPRPFHLGVLEGFWWAFVTMTTVGYGDRSPRGYAARVFAILWVLIGLIFIAITTGVITTRLTAVATSTDLRLYGAKVGALANSTEYRMGVKANSDVVEFTTVEAMFNALKSSELDGVLLDTFVAAESKDMLSSNVRVNKIVSYDSSYGIVFRGEMASGELQTCFNNFASTKKGEISDLVDKNTTQVKEPKKSAAEEITSGLFDTSTKIFKNALFSCLGLLLFFLACGLIWDYGYKRHYKKNTTEFDDLALPAGFVSETVKANMKLLDTLMQEIQDFNDVWTEKLDGIVNKHDAEYQTFSMIQTQTRKHAS